MTLWTHTLAAGLDRMLQVPQVRAVGCAARELSGLLLPAVCAVCGAEDGTVCPACAAELAGSLLHPYRAEEDAAALPLVSRRPEAAPAPLAVVSAGRYGGALARALLSFKDHGRTPVGRHLRPAVHRALAAAPGLLAPAEPEDVAGSGPSGLIAAGPDPSPTLLVPVPGSAAGFRRRGYDPVAELLTGRLPPGWELATGLLRHARVRSRHGSSRRVGPMASHSGTASTLRRHRSVGRYRATDRTHRLEGRTVVLFDDVMTTGSTLAAAWQALDRAGLRPVAAVVLAAVTAPGAEPSGGLTPGDEGTTL